MKLSYIFTGILLVFSTVLLAQERVVKVDFEANAFKNSPLIPYDKPFMIEGEVYRDVEYVQVEIYDAGGRRSLHTFNWNRDERNLSETFSIAIPAILAANNKYDFKIITYKLLSDFQKKELVENLGQRIAYYFLNNYQFDGKKVSIKNPNKTYKGLQALIDEALALQLSKNSVSIIAPSTLILEELKKTEDFNFNAYLKKNTVADRDCIANSLIENKVNHITDMVMSELMPYLNSQLVQQHRNMLIPSVSTDKAPFTLPVNVGAYAWNMNIFDDVKNYDKTNFTIGAGISLPFYRNSTKAGRSRVIDEPGISLGVLFKPIADEDGTKFTTPGINLPVYTALGVRLFKVTRLNAGVLFVNETGSGNINNLQIVPTIGLAFELDLWLGIKR
ncbi:MAG: hypothetical protein ACK5KP_03820 [Paludibacteraceae bacterium]